MRCSQIFNPIDILACLMKQKSILALIEDSGMPYLTWHVIQQLDDFQVVLIVQSTQKIHFCFDLYI